MSKISTYPSADSPLLLSDRLIGTEAIRTPPTATPLATKNFSLQELLQLFSSNFPAATLQAVLNAGNIATQNISLTGTITTTLIVPTNIEDTLGSQGTTFQFLSKAVSGINWVNLPVDNLQAVLNAGNTATQNIILTGDITSTKIIPGNIQDDTSGIGTVGQLLSKTASGIRWINNPTITTPGLNDVLLVGNTATNNITLIGNITATSIIKTGGTNLQYLMADGSISTGPSLVGYVPYVGATTNLNMGAFFVDASEYKFLDSAYSVYGRLFLDAEEFRFMTTPTATLATINYGQLLLKGISLYSATLTYTTLTADRTYALPNASGTVALTSNIGTWGALNYPTWTTGTPFVKMTAAGTFALDTNTYLTSAVTSIGMTVPSAFNVTPSTITSSGTFAITGAGVASQYIRGDGTLANFPTSTGGGASVSYYLNGSISQGTIGGVAYKEINSVPVIGAGTDFTINADGYIAQFITDVGDPNKLLIPAGNWNFETYFSASSGGGSPQFYIELYKYNGTTFTLIATNSATPEYITGGTSIDLYFTALAVPATSLLVTDRLAVRFYVIHSGRTITMHTENSHLSQIITTFSSGLTALNGLTSQVQYLAVGTAGTNFNISSVTDTHTFNLPTASATNRGALSTTDWSTFNGKFNLPSLTSGSVLFSNGTTIAQDNANLFWDDTNNRLGIGTASPLAKLHVTGTNNVGLQEATIFQAGTAGGANVGGPYISLRPINAGLPTWELARIGAFNTAFSYSGDIVFYTNDGTTPTSLTEKVRIQSNGNVGIGMTPTAKLTIKAPGALSTDIALRIRNSADSGDLFTIAGDGSGILSRDLTINGISVGIGKNNIASNTILGFQVFPFLTTGNNNASVGTQSSFSFTTGSLNAALGVAALFGNSTGSNNVGIGFESGRFIADGTTASTIYNTSVFIGASTKSLANGQANQIVIGYNATGLGSNSVVLGNDSIVTTALKGNIGIGTTAPAASSKLDITSTTQGVLFPRMTTTQKNAIASPATGLVVLILTHKKAIYTGLRLHGMASCL